MSFSEDTSRLGNHLISPRTTLEHLSKSYFIDLSFCVFDPATKSLSCLRERNRASAKETLKVSSSNVADRKAATN